MSEIGPVLDSEKVYGDYKAEGQQGGYKVGYKIMSVSLIVEDCHILVSHSVFQFGSAFTHVLVTQVYVFLNVSVFL